MENHTVPERSTGPGRPKGLTHQNVLKIRDQVYRFHLFGLNQEQISGHLNISQSQVSRHIEAARKGKLWTGEKPVRDRANILIQTQFDRFEVWHNEQARIYHSLEMPLEEKALRIRMIGDVMRGVGLMSQYVPDATMLGLLDGYQVLGAELERTLQDDIEWRDRIMQEARLSQRVISEPLNHPRLRMRQTGPNSWEAKGGS